MKTSYLFPRRFKVVSGILFVLSLLLLIYVVHSDTLNISTRVFAVMDDAPFMGDLSSYGKVVYFNWTNNSITDELCMVMVIVSGIVFAFSKEKHEDEMVTAIRLHSLAWATLINYALLLLSYFFIYGTPFFSVLLAAMFTQLIIFILLFRFKMYRFYTASTYEE